MKNRSELWEIIIKVLYQIYIYENSNISYDIDNLINEQIEKSNDFVNDTVKGIISKKDELINLANKYLKDWTIDRLGLTDAAIIEIAIYEIKYMDTPNIVVINEALELAKKYSDDAVRKMINACLDRIINE